MAKSYFPKYMSPMPSDVYQVTLQFIRGHERRKKEAEAMAHTYKSPAIDGMPKGTNVGDPVQKAVFDRDQLMAEIAAVEDALKQLDPFYREPIYRAISRTEAMVMQPEYHYADPSTWKKQKKKFIYWVAYNIGLQWL